MRRFSLRNLLVAAILALPLSFGGMSLEHVSASSTSNNGVGTYCKQNIQYLDLAVYYTLLSSPFPVSQPPTLSQGACTSLLVTFVNGTYATSAPYVSICQDIASSEGITDPSFQGQCVAYFSSSGIKYLTNYYIGGTYFFGP